MKETYKQEAERLYPFDDPRKNMFHDNSGQRSRRSAHIKARQMSEQEIRELREENERLKKERYETRVVLHRIITKAKKGDPVPQKTIEESEYILSKYLDVMDILR